MIKKALLIIGMATVLLMIGAVTTVTPQEEPENMGLFGEAKVDSVVIEDGQKVIYVSNTINNIFLYHMANAMRAGGMQEPIKTRYIYFNDDTTDLTHSDEVDTTNNWTRFDSADTTYEDSTTLTKAHLLDDYDSLLTTAVLSAHLDSAENASIKWTINVN